jgi:hypothetical protein
MMVYVRFHLLILLLTWSLVIVNSFLLIFFCQSVSSSSKSDNRTMIIVKSIDDYLCQNHIFTCFFRRRYHPSFNQQESDNCKSLLILRSCLHYDTESIRLCPQITLNQAKHNLTDETPTYCFTSSVYKTFYTQHLHSIALPRTTINCQIFMFFLLLISFTIRMRICC